MVYIGRDGTIYRNAAEARSATAGAPPPRLVVQYLVVILGALLTARSFISKGGALSNPLANGRVPAASIAPENHWSKLKGDPLLVRRMMSGIAASNVIDADLLGAVAAEEVDWKKGPRMLMEFAKVTRCATTQHAVTAYFCGARVASNELNDVVLGGDDHATATSYRPNEGVDSFSYHLECRHSQGEESGGVHKRSVYRINFFPDNDELIFGHTFNIVAQPDGTFLWLQSFIGFYSLSSWLDQTDSTHSGRRGHVTLSEVLAKLDQISVLMEVESWDDEANSIYDDLFHADKSDVSKEWNTSHRLSSFIWDEACEYPVPDEYDANTDVAENGNEKDDDECVSEETKAFSTLLLSVMRGDFDFDDEVFDNEWYGYDDECVRKYVYEDDYYFDDDDEEEYYMCGYDDHYHLYDEDEEDDDTTDFS